MGVGAQQLIDIRGHRGVDLLLRGGIDLLSLGSRLIVGNHADWLRRHKGERGVIGFRIGHEKFSLL